MKNFFIKMGAFFKKVDKTKLWAVGGQVLFAIFIIIAMYGVAFKSSNYGRTGLSDGFNIGSDVYGLGIAGIVIAFVGIIMPLVSLFYTKSKLVNFAMGWTTVLFDAAALATITAAISLFAVNGDDLGGKYNKGYLAGQLIFDLFGALIAGAGLYMSYKDDFLSFNPINLFMMGKANSAND